MLLFLLLSPFSSFFLLLAEISTSSPREPNIGKLSVDSFKSSFTAASMDRLNNSPGSAALLLQRREGREARIGYWMMPHMALMESERWGMLRTRLPSLVLCRQLGLQYFRRNEEAKQKF
ncbi:hypothetical protein NE237_022226 [Protea cynaroides]|uniref:Secreted protein n=1 Tax=Protea cynaroides TaxID=273540 RepID=A0A9Q0H9C5_9MAGN|nr:hypothetical protein NE237_022226 [Protea cynaroides]